MSPGTRTSLVVAIVLCASAFPAPARTARNESKNSPRASSANLHPHLNAPLGSWCASSEKAAELPEIRAGSNVDNEYFVKTADAIFNNDEQELARHSIGKLILMALVHLVQAATYRNIFFHRYDSFEDMKRAAGPDVNNELCLGQLNDMVRRVERQERAGFASRDLNILRIRETWASGPRKMLEGNLFAEGDYENCLRLRLEQAGSEGTKLRYCVQSLKLPEWPQLDKRDILQVQAGICIPSSCDSLDYKNKYDLISKIASYHLDRADSMRMSHLYCLPDERSEFRSIWHSPKSLATLICVMGWISLQLYATYRCRRLNCAGNELRFYQMFSIECNLFKLFKVAPATDGNEVKAEESSRGLGESVDKQMESGFKLDFGCIEAIKVISMCYIIMGHVLMCLPAMVANGNMIASERLLSVTFLLANMLPAYAVNSFFVITGLLTSYMMLKQHERQRVITSPIKWLVVILYRYLRIMPMYALAVLYCKTLAKFAGSGPLWDYGTSALSQRRVCEHESWRWTLTFTSNFLPPLEHCVPGGWYLSNDFQFCLLTPVFMLALYKRPHLGRLLLYATIATGSIASFLSLVQSKVTDLRPIAYFAPAGFKTYVSHLSFNYTQPQYRIPAYLIGLLIGEKLYRLETEKARFSRLPAAERSGQAAPCWSAAFKNYGAYSTLVLIVGYLMTPFFACAIHANKLGFSPAVGRFMVALVNSSYHLIVTSVVGMFIALAATGHANKQVTRLLSANFWKPLARLSLCAVLVNVEVINYIVQTRTSQISINNTSQTLLNCVCIAATYLVSTLVCVLFEAPIRTVLNLFLGLLMNKAGRRSKAD